MGWEERNGNRYYYRKRRMPDGTVKSEYVGKGRIGELAASLDRSRRAQREQERRRFERMKEDLRRQRDKVRCVQRTIRALERTTLLLNDYHTHKGQWRKRRE